jgi:eukaryotic-like serine/threonine-protein kinase
MAPTPLREGDPTRIGQYRLTARLGAGGMGVVYLGTAKDGAKVAVKVPRPELADDPEFRIRFRREVTTLTRVQGVCTVRVIEADTDSPNPFLATEYAEGPSLSEYVSASGPLIPDLLYGLATGLAEALGAIHASGVIHRDLKPSNVLLTSAGPKVIDFGIAQTLDATAMTKTGMTVGSVGFMAPEQIVGRPGQEADVFAWGLVIGFAASGRQPYGTGPNDVILFRIMHGAPDITSVTGPLRPLVEAALSKNPAERPTAIALVQRLAGENHEPGYTPTQSVLARTWQMAVPSDGTVTHVTRRRRGRTAVLVAAAAAVAAAAGTGVALATSAGPSQPPAGVTATTSPGAGGQQGTSSPGPTTAVSAGGYQLPPLLATVDYSGTRPTAIDLGASEALEGLTWSTWSPTEAVATGIMPADNCQPNCAEGQTTDVPVIVTLGGVAGASAIDGGHYTTLRVADRDGGALVYAASTNSLTGASGGTEGNY